MLSKLLKNSEKINFLGEFYQFFSGEYLICLGEMINKKYFNVKSCRVGFKINIGFVFLFPSGGRRGIGGRIKNF